MALQHAFTLLRGVSWLRNTNLLFSADLDLDQGIMVRGKKKKLSIKRIQCPKIQ